MQSHPRRALAAALVHSWGLLEADATLTGILVAVFIAFAIAYLVRRLRGASKRRKR